MLILLIMQLWLYSFCVVIQFILWVVLCCVSVNWPNSCVVLRDMCHLLLLCVLVCVCYLLRRIVLPLLPGRHTICTDIIIIIIIIIITTTTTTTTILYTWHVQLFLLILIALHKLSTFNIFLITVVWNLDLITHSDTFLRNRPSQVMWTYKLSCFCAAYLAIFEYSVSKY
jgi:hypothetical protein